jgi:hypothetical protein
MLRGSWENLFAKSLFTCNSKWADDPRSARVACTGAL